MRRSFSTHTPSVRTALALLAGGSLFVGACSSGKQTSTAETSSSPSEPAETATTATVPTVDRATTQAAPAETIAAPATSTPATDDSPVTPSPTASEGSTDGTSSVTVESTDQQYFVVFAVPGQGAPEVPISLAMGAAGSTTITYTGDPLGEGQYRVEAFDVASPGDVDDDGVDDMAEVADDTLNPLNGAKQMDESQGDSRIASAERFSEMSYQGDEVARDGYLAGLEFVKFIITGADTDHPSVYFMNTENHRAHPPFAEMVGIDGVRGRGGVPGVMRGDIVFTPDAAAPDGSTGRYRFAFQPRDAFTFAEIAVAYEALVANAPFLGGKLMYYPFPDSALPQYDREKSSYEAYRVPVLIEE